jgi:hypothetical protein
VGGDPAPRQPVGGPPAQAPQQPQAPQNGGQAQQSYRATEPPAQPGGGARPSGGRLADRIITIVLLALGAYGALSLALSLQQVPQQFRLIGTVLGAENLTVPESVGVVGTVGAILVLAVYAVNLIFSIQRLRARKLAFWVPLVAFALALVVLFVCTIVAVNALPELMQLMSDPDALSKMLNNAATLG